MNGPSSGSNCSCQHTQKDKSSKRHGNSRKNHSLKNNSTNAFDLKGDLRLGKNMHPVIHNLNRLTSWGSRGCGIYPSLYRAVGGVHPKTGCHPLQLIACTLRFTPVHKSVASPTPLCEGCGSRLLFVPNIQVYWIQMRVWLFPGPMRPCANRSCWGC